ncbi:hypothetical protein PG911_10455 [Tenacibaculum ovolyticum]|uniref:hypothetical protein n=1 Tax=Tenacibaculum ovolyticum TaxID=104270 RepID=UPI0022F38987|nr:hypothetical protein [Tenacibaculum ovolyticum]WBX75078.1 hypothetical protein PG911_10455 [Tenacibaculum ovolyticum]
MKVIKKSVCFLFILTVFICCKEQILKKDKLKKTTISNIKNFKIVDENNYKDIIANFSIFDNNYTSFKKTTLINKIFYTATFLPKDYYILKNLKTIDSLDYYRVRIKNEEVVQFDLQDIDGKDLLKDKTLNYEDYIKYLSFNIKNDFYAISKKGDTIKANGVFFERNYSLAPYKRLLVYFKFPYEIKEEVKLVYNDKLFKNGIIKFLLNKKNSYFCYAK